MKKKVMLSIIEAKKEERDIMINLLEKYQATIKKEGYKTYDYS